MQLLEEAGRSTLAITGAAGRIATALVPLLRRPGRQLRLIDQRPNVLTGDDLSRHRLDISDEDALREVFIGADAVIHLAGIAREAAWEDILRVNVAGTQRVLEAARRAGVTRLLLASSVHAVGYVAADAARAAHVLPPQPDTFYGWSKAATEALGSLYADRYGMTIVSARICTFQPEPRDDGRTPALWFSPTDAARLVEATAVLNDGAHHIVWGVSANAPAWLPLASGHEIGFAPSDDAVGILREVHGRVPAPLDRAQLLGGAFTDSKRPLGSSW